METILSYFPELTDTQREQLARLGPAYRRWNQRINVISRRDIDNLYLRHVLHSLAIARVVRFRPGSAILDLGTGGGFPGIPLAILFPEARFTLIDGTAKKIRVVKEVAEAAELRNVVARQERAENVRQTFDFVVSRAVARLDRLMQWSRPLLAQRQQHALPNGLIALKGGAVQEEIETLGRSCYVEAHPLSDFFSEPFFQEKYAVYVQG